jgi:hypothetical protein
MTKSLHFTREILAISVASVLTFATFATLSSAHAQPAGNSQAASSQADKGQDRSVDMETQRKAQIESRITYLKELLKITSAQERVWNAYADTLRAQNAAQTKDRDARRPTKDAQKQDKNRPTLLDRLDNRKKQLDEQSANLANVEKTLRPLYAALSDEQKKEADRVLMDSGFGGGGFGMGGMGGPGGGFGGGRGPGGMMGGGGPGFGGGPGGRGNGPNDGPGGPRGSF